MRDWLRAVPDSPSDILDPQALRHHYDGCIRRLLQADVTRFDWMEAYFARFTQPVHFNAFYRLLTCFRRYHDFRNWFNTSHMNIAILNMVLHFDRRVREPEIWVVPATNESLDVVMHMARHLFEHYPVPHWLGRFWYQSLPEKGAGWYFHVAAGGSIYHLEDPPIPVTRAMAHLLANAPADRYYPGVFRWAQLKAMNMPEAVMEWLAETRFWTSFENEDFWETVFQLIAREYNPETMDEEELGLLLVYLGYTKLGLVVGGENNQQVTPPEPGFTMKGRKLTALLRDAKRWYGQNAASFRQWEPSGINTYVETEGPEDKPVNFVMVELLNSYELSTEGQAMSHCVGDYSENCRESSCSIWSLRRYEGERFRRLVTIEVTVADRMLVQICGPCNEPPTESDLGLITRWAQQEKLNLGEFAPAEAEPVVIPQEQGVPAPPVHVPAPQVAMPALDIEIPARVMRPQADNVSDRATWITVVLIAKAAFLVLRALAS